MASSEPKHISSFLGDMTTVTGDCPKHGYWSADVPGVFACRARCRKCAEEAAAAEEAAKKEAKRKAAEDRRIRDLASIGVSARHLGKTFDTFIAENNEQKRNLDACREISDAVCKGSKRISSLILSGAPGTGKTHLSCAMIQQCYDAGKEVDKSNVIQIIRNIKETWRKDSEQEESEVIGYYTSRDLLVIDEIGVQFGSETERLYVFEIINERYERCLPTVLITNLDADGLRAEVGDRVLDRLREDGGRLLTFTGQSYRRQ